MTRSTRAYQLSPQLAALLLAGLKVGLKVKKQELPDLFQKCDNKARPGSAETPREPLSSPTVGAVMNA